MDQPDAIAQGKVVHDLPVVLGEEGVIPVVILELSGDIVGSAAGKAKLEESEGPAKKLVSALGRTGRPGGDEAI